MGITPDEFGPDDLPEFIKLIKDALVLFVGEENSKDIVAKIEESCKENGLE
jgi:hypothetical protein